MTDVTDVVATLDAELSQLLDPTFDRKLPESKRARKDEEPRETASVSTAFVQAKPDPKTSGEIPTPVTEHNERASGSPAKEQYSPARAAERTYYRRANEANLGALCLSGGGIRSASFSLGVVQALARFRPAPSNFTGPAGEASAAEHSLLSRFDYLSTVSGGGYTGSFLSSWIARAGFKSVWDQLVGRPEGPTVEPTPLDWLRDYSSYLTPRRGLGSADLWTAIALVLRNMLLNWLVLLPMLCLILLLFSAWVFAMSALTQISDIPLWTPTLACLLTVGLFALVLSLRFTSNNRPTRNPSSSSTTRDFLLFDLIPLMVAAACFEAVLLLPSSKIILISMPFAESVSKDASYFSFFLCGALWGACIYALSWCFAWRSAADPEQKLYDLLAWIVGGAVFGIVLFSGAFIFVQMMTPEGEWVRHARMGALIAGVPWFVLSHLAGEMIFVGASSYETRADDDREWLARAAGYYGVVGACWLLIVCVLLLGHPFVSWAWDQAAKTLTSTAILSTLTTVVLSAIKNTPAAGAKPTTAGISMNVILGVAAPICGLSIIVGTAVVLDQTLYGTALRDAAFSPSGAPVQSAGWIPLYTHLLWTTTIIGTIGWLAGLFININRFSLHALYRNRIIRAFLGASHAAAIGAPTRNPFSGFDTSDNLNMHQLWPTTDDRKKKGGPQWVPLHMINIALNLVASEKLAWQERKAESFTVSPLFSGAAQLGYRPSKEYGDPKGITVGTAVAISGAAASPNMGYHSSPALAFLMTWFNVRLGWWLGNPKVDRAFRREGPKLAQLPLIEELIGSTTDKRDYVYLSDGGHFENLGLYEMIRRRCRRIVVVDAGCDPDFSFEDLGNAIRKIGIDLGVRFHFSNMPSLHSRTDAQGLNAQGACQSWAHADIFYKDADGEGKDGELLYIKPTFYKSLLENVSVLNYGMAHDDFPHQSTADQWFDESQFESYRLLGFEIMAKALEQSRFDLVL